MALVWSKPGLVVIIPERYGVLSVHPCRIPLLLQANLHVVLILHSCIDLVIGIKESAVVRSLPFIIL
jgi:hypothetical protein